MLSFIPFTRSLPDVKKVFQLLSYWYWRVKMSIGTWQDFEASLANSNYQILQSNGQRIYTPVTAARIQPPAKGSEIFVGNLPHDLFEDELIPLFSSRRPIYNLRLMLDFYGRNRGYAFISYFTPEDAHHAVATFNNCLIRNKTRLAVSISVDNRRLFIGNIHREKNVGEIRQVLEQYVEGIVDVILYNDPKNPLLNRGFVFVEFQSHRLAAIARRQLAPGNLVLWGRSIYVDWAEPLPVVSPDVLKNVTKLYLSNLPTDICSSQLRELLESLVREEHILKVHKIDDFAFVHFTLRKYAEEAFRVLQGLTIRGKVIGVEWARPIEYSKAHRMTKFPENYCRSVPPNMRRMVQQSVCLRKMPKISKVAHCGHQAILNAASTESTSGMTYDEFVQCFERKLALV